MGYRPSDDAEHKKTLNKFFDWCVQKNVPIFVHCTPEGFQTSKKLGLNAHPKYWREILKERRWNKLRLCFGHAGGGQ